ncbi:putative reverse transcriptase domain-containing protein [Tanacetum coccineum]
MDKSWMRTSRTKKQYIDGVEAFIKYAVHNLQKMRNIDPRGNKQQLMMPCPCTTCFNYIEHKVEEVQFHLFKYGIDLSYTKWDKHGEKDEQATTAQIPVNATTKFLDDTDFDMDFGLEIPTDGPATVEMVNATKESFDEDDLAKFQELLLDAEKPLYKGCPDFTKLSAIVKLLNLKGKYGASDKFFTELLGLLKKMLPAVDSMVCSMWEKIQTVLDFLPNPKQCKSYVGHGRYLPYTNPFRKQKKAFNGQQEFLQAPIPMTGEQIYNENVAESIVKTLLHVSGKTKDGLNARLDLAELGVKPELFAMQDEDKTTLPPVGYTLTNAEKDNFVNVTQHQVERELAIDKESVSETVRWISYGPLCHRSEIRCIYIIGIFSDDNVMMARLPEQWEIIDISLDSSDDRRWAAKKASALVFYGSSTQGLLDAYGYNTIEEYLSWNYFPSIDNESTDMETTDKRNTDKDCIVDSNSAMFKACTLHKQREKKPWFNKQFL